MEIITGTALSNMCDYSFGDHLGGLDPHALVGGFMKEASIKNTEFLERAKQFEGKVMTLFIDNIRLYPRTIYVANNPWDIQWVKHLMATNDLLGLCATLTKNKFIIFCSHEDTPIDSQIVLPDNVLEIHAVNAEFNNDRIFPFPYGLQRQILRPNEDYDDRVNILKGQIGVKIEPTKLLYINCGVSRNNVERAYLLNFEDKLWTTTRFNKDSMHFPYSKYLDFLNEMRDHKFMVCPQGHGMDCHRNWELLYLNRVPVMKDHPYFRRLMAGFPVLFVNDWSDVSKELLEANDHLYQEAQKIDLDKLDLRKIYDGIVKKYD